MEISAFKGLQNITDPLRLGLGWLSTAQNVNITDTGGIEKREGYSRVKTGSYSAIYTTQDYQRMYLVDGSTIKTFDGVTVSNLTSTARMYWAETNNIVYYNNGTDSGVIAPDHSVTAWRGAPVSYGAGFKGADGQDLTVLFDTLPLGATVIQFWKGRAYAAQYFPSDDQTVVWCSEPLGFHLFNLDSSFFIVSGEVTMLAPHDAALIVGTNTEVLAYSGDKIEQLADYGVTPGDHWAKDNDRILFWTVRGICAALPFTNLTERSVSVAPGIQAGGTIVRQGGQKRYLVALHQGGSAFNAF